MSLSVARLLPPPDAIEDAVDPDASDSELVAALVRQNDSVREARVRAGYLLDLAGGAWGLAHLGKSELATAGLSEDSIARVRAAIALGARVAAAKAPTHAMDARAVDALLRPLLVHLPHEEMHVVVLDIAGRYRFRRRVSSGGVAACSVHVKDVLAPAIEQRAPHLVVVHNHPSGYSQPSPDDFQLTRRLAAAGDAVGVRLIDHLVIAEDGHASAMPGPTGWSALRKPPARSAP
jgi:DNA repair protein RadC